MLKANFLAFEGRPSWPVRAAFIVIPIAYRIFADEILGYDLRKWIAFYFIVKSGHSGIYNFIYQIGQVCSALFHGYSVDHLRRIFADMHYDRVNFTQVKLTTKPNSALTNQVLTT